MARGVHSLFHLKYETMMKNRTYQNPTSVALDEFFRSFAPAQNAAPWSWAEKDDAWEGQLDLPGFTKDEVTVSLDKERVLSVVAKQPELEEGETRDFARNERTFKLQLPREAAAEKLTAVLENGVLNLNIPKVTPDSAIERRIELN